MSATIQTLSGCAWILGLLSLGGCTSSPAAHSHVGTPLKIELLGFPGCPHTPAMREHLRAARGSGPASAFADVNQETLPESDIRRGWPTPTILVDGHDLFGMPAPSAPAMGCRVYPGGVPSAEEIRSRLAHHAQSRAPGQ